MPSPLIEPTAHRLARLAGILAAVLALSLGSLAASRETSLPVAVEYATRGITADTLESHVTFIAGEQFEGRGVGQPGNTLAELYLASVLEQIGLEPVYQGTYFQPFVLRRGPLGQANTLTVHRPEPGSAVTHQAGTEFYPHPVSLSQTVTAGVVFAGYGISAPELWYDDYAGVDTAGKIVLVLDHEPQEHDPQSRFGGMASTAHASIARKVETATAFGAAGVLIVPDTAQHAAGSLPPVSRTWPETARYVLAGTEADVPVAYVSAGLAEDILGTGPESQGTRLAVLQERISAALDEAGRDGMVLSPASFAVAGGQVTLSVDPPEERIVPRNVLGYIEGSDPTRHHELVVLGAHLDHDGIRNGSIYFGADDNASGTAAVLEIAAAFARAAEAGVRPSRPVLFALWNAEEIGQLGSRHFVREPLPRGTTPIAKINLDMIGRSEEVLNPSDPRFRDLPHMTSAENRNVLHLLGYSYSPAFAVLVAEENAAIQLTVKTEYDTQSLNLLRRSDQWPFLERQIPAIFLTTGLHPDYHTPDDRAEKLDYEKMERVAQLAARVTWRLANDDSLPAFQIPRPQSEQ